MIIKQFRRVAKQLQKATINFVMSLSPPVRTSFRHPAKNNSAPTGRIFMKIDVVYSYKILSLYYSCG
jgi:hypothetical protein